MMKSKKSSETDIATLGIGVEELTHQFQQANSFWRSFFRGIVVGLGTAIGATIVAAIVIALMSRLIHTADDVPLFKWLIDKMEVQSVIDESLNN